MPAIGEDDRVLLGSLLAQHLGPLCGDEAVVEAALVPLLDDMAGDLSIDCSAPAAEEGSGSCNDSSDDGNGESAGCERRLSLGRQRLGRLLELLAVVLEEDELQALVSTTCQVSNRRLVCLLV